MLSNQENTEIPARKVIRMLLMEAKIFLKGAIMEMAEQVYSCILWNAYVWRTFKIF